MMTDTASQVVIHCARDIFLARVSSQGRSQPRMHQRRPGNYAWKRFPPGSLKFDGEQQQYDISLTFQ
jgi:hypothetical protein